MRIQCPSCAAIYEVADGLLNQPRTVRCARCGKDWTPSPMPDDVTAAPEMTAAEHAAAVPEAVTAATAMDRAGAAATASQAQAQNDAAAEHPDTAPPLGGRAEDVEETPPLATISGLARQVDPKGDENHGPWVMLTWGASFLLLLALVMLLYVMRVQVMNVWPASERVYALLGLVPHHP
jgi:predicted Zn finger-like uncharacterized protein